MNVTKQNPVNKFFVPEEDKRHTTRLMTAVKPTDDDRPM